MNDAKIWLQSIFNIGRYKTNTYYSDSSLLYGDGITTPSRSYCTAIYGLQCQTNVQCNQQRFISKNSGKVKSVRKLNLVIRFTLKGFASLIRNLISSCHLSLIQQQICRSHVYIACIHKTSRLKMLSKLYSEWKWGA